MQRRPFTYQPPQKKQHPKALPFFAPALPARFSPPALPSVLSGHIMRFFWKNFSMMLYFDIERFPFMGCFFIPRQIDFSMVKERLN